MALISNTPRDQVINLTKFLFGQTRATEENSVPAMPGWVRGNAATIRAAHRFAPAQRFALTILFMPLWIRTRREVSAGAVVAERITTKVLTYLLVLILNTLGKFKTLYHFR